MGYWNAKNAIKDKSQYKIIIGERGNGKSYAIKNAVIDDFLLNGNEFIYLRRMKEDIKPSMVESYFSDLNIDKKTKEVEGILHSSMKNKELFQLMSINKSLVYLSTSLNANKVVLTKVARLPEYKKYEADFDLLEDVEIENNQAIEMCSIYRDILAGSMDAYASIISNNLNIVMKILAIITLIISIPNLIASLFGMNVDVPTNNTKAGFWIIIAISCCLSIIGSVALWYFSSKRKIK